MKLVYFPTRKCYWMTDGKCRATDGNQRTIEETFKYLVEDHSGAGGDLVNYLILAEFPNYTTYEQFTELYPELLI